MNNNIIQHQVFIEDSGQKEFIDPYDRKTVDHPNKKDRSFWLKNYFVIAGLVIDKQNIPKINREIVNLKNKTFGTPFVEIKSDWLRNPFQREKRYLKPFGISERKLDKFGVKISNLFPKHKKEITIITCIFDKMENSLSPERGRNGELRDVLLNNRRMKNTFV